MYHEPDHDFIQTMIMMFIIIVIIIVIIMHFSDGADYQREPVPQPGGSNACRGHQALLLYHSLGEQVVFVKIAIITIVVIIIIIIITIIVFVITTITITIFNEIITRTVSWVRHSDIHLLTAGKDSYTDDRRWD